MLFIIYNRCLKWPALNIVYIVVVAANACITRVATATRFYRLLLKSRFVPVTTVSCYVNIFCIFGQIRMNVIEMKGILNWMKNNIGPAFLMFIIERLMSIVLVVRWYLWWWRRWFCYCWLRATVNSLYLVKCSSRGNIFKCIFC